MQAFHIRPADPDADADALWRILEPVIRAGETYALERDLGRADTLAYWLAPTNAVFVAAAPDGAVLGTYTMRANQRGGGAHVANCGYVTAPDASGRGVARGMAAHSLDEARRRGFRAMQFNFVVAANVRAVRLWEQLGFETVGRLPGAFAHPRLGEVDALVMYRRL
ncbi:MAG: N-acetyltransferase family protein [Salinarimonas sp.]